MGIRIGQVIVCFHQRERERPKTMKYIKQNEEDYNEAADNTIGK